MPAVSQLQAVKKGMVIDMNDFIKKAFRPGRLIVAVVFMAILVLIGTQKVLAETKQDFPYLLKVNRVHNTITVYEKDAKGKYNTPVKAILCSVGKEGTQTVLGTYNTKAKYRWKELMGKVYGQYSTRIVGGILFHSVYYYENGNPATLATKEFNKLGAAASHGCIRLTVQDAKWIYDNCPVGTTVIIYDDKSSPGPLGKPEAIKLPSSMRWDPTDPNKKNPYKNKKPTIKGVTNHTISWGSQLDLLEGVIAKSSLGAKISNNIVIQGLLNIYQSGTYSITYTVTDALGRSASKKSKVIVEENPNPPVIEGVHDGVIKSGSTLTSKTVLSGVSIRFGDKAADAKGLKATIEPAGGSKYRVTYSYWIDELCVLETIAFYYIDGEAPVFSGIANRTFQLDQVVDKEFALSGITITDNYTEMNMEDIEVRIEPVPYNKDLVHKILEEITNEVDGDPLTNEQRDNGFNNINEEEKEPLIYQITYTAEDEVGNKASTMAYFVSDQN